MERLRNLYAGQTVWIIGKGPSLQYLRAEHIGVGPVITINSAIREVEKIDIPNPVFSMQKDGGPKRKFDYATLSSDCEHWPNGCDSCCNDRFRPRKGAALLVHRHESLYCFSDYSPRYIFAWDELGLPHNEFSLILAVKIGQFMGCSKFRFISCDVHANGDMRTYIPGIGLVMYDFLIKNQIGLLKPYLAGLDCEYITPTEKMGG